MNCQIFNSKKFICVGVTELHSLKYLSRFDVCRLKGLVCRVWIFVRVYPFFVLFREFEGVLFGFLCSWVVEGWGVPQAATPDHPLGGGWEILETLGNKGLYLY